VHAHLSKHWEELFKQKDTVTGQFRMPRFQSGLQIEKHCT